MTEYINLENIVEKENIRTDTQDDELSELMSSIQQHGLLQPILVFKSGADKYTVVLGHRRLAAMRKLGWERVEVDRHVRIFEDKMSVEKFLILNTTENIQRKDVSPIELGRMIDKLKNEFDMSLEEISVRLSAPITRIRNAVDLYRRTPNEFREFVGYKDDRNAKKNIKTVGKLSPSQLKLAMDARFSKSKMNEFLHLIKRENIAGSQIGIIRSFLENSPELTMDDALKLADRYQPVTVKLIVNKKKYAAFRATNTMPFSKYVRKIMKREDGNLIL